MSMADISCDKIYVRYALIILHLILLTIPRTSGGQTLNIYENPELSFDERINDLISRMTLEEKISQMMHESPAIERLNIPKYNWWNECLHGVARAGIATVYPQAIGLAATWDTSLMFRVATAISDEARAKHHEFLRRGKRNIYQGLTFWSPNVNIFRDPRWGRGMETYGEDPYLTARMGVAFIKGLQGNDEKYLKVAATAKHYAVHSGPEPDRHHFDAETDERDLRETYLPHFKACVQDAGVESVMCAYNRYMGEACCGSNRLLKEILREEWGFKGHVVSDCGAIGDIHARHKIVDTPEEASALGVKSGCDLNCGCTFISLLKAVHEGYITEPEIDTALVRLFSTRFKLGMFDPPEMVPYSKISYSVVDCDEHRQLALEAARKSIVLLKNDGGLLPLKKDMKTIAVIGPNANDVETLLGNYYGFPAEPVTPLEGIKRKVDDGTEVLYAPGSRWAAELPLLSVIPSSAFRVMRNGESVNGLKAAYYTNSKLTGEPLLERIDPNIDFMWWDGSPGEAFDDDDFSVRWSGTLVPPETGTYAIGAEGFNWLRVYIEDSLVVEFEHDHHTNKVYEFMDLEADREYKIVVEFGHHLGDGQMKLLWELPDTDYHGAAVDAASKADVAIMVMGLTPRLEGEEMPVKVKGFKAGDREDIVLPETQGRLIKDIYATGVPVVLVLMNGSAIAINWADAHIPAIVNLWYPGQAGGDALADVLFGDYNPGGRLPVTFYKSIDQLPPFEQYQMTTQTYRYFDGEPLYPFGYGLSYTKFEYSNLEMPDTVQVGEEIDILVDVKNAGEVKGAEIVQLYVSDETASVPVPLRKLVDFQRIFLQPEESQTVKFTITPADLSLIDENNMRAVEPGAFLVTIGGIQPGSKENIQGLTTQVLETRLNVKGDVHILDD
jgi:beta-glucosidase